MYRTKLRRANLHFLSEPIKDGTTGTVIVLTTSDAQRTMLAYQVKYVLMTKSNDITDTSVLFLLLILSSVYMIYSCIPFMR